MKSLFLLFVFVLAIPGYAIKLSDYRPFDYQVAFTNPICRNYSYKAPLEREGGGELIYARPKDVYCKSRDKKASLKRPDSPLSLLLSWIEHEQTQEIFMSYLSYSSSRVATALCTAMRERGVKVHLIYDSNNEKSETHTESGKVIYPRMRFIHKLQGKECQFRVSDGQHDQRIWAYPRGGEGRGRNKLGYAHNKLLIINPQNLEDPEQESVRIAFSSGNMSSGVTIHHENWHFITTHPQSYFAQAHLCLLKGMKEHAGGLRQYGQFISQCKEQIKAEEEEDIKTFFVPGEGKRAEQSIAQAIERAHAVDVAAHRFTYRWIEQQMGLALEAQKPLRLILDDDLYWTEKLQTNMGRNMLFEARKVRRLVDQGLQVAYMETNGGIADPERQDEARPYLHHNKFFIFHFAEERGAVFAGAGNLTKSAFTKNFENFYYITVRNERVDVYQSFKEQYRHMWENLATLPADMPVELEMP